MEATSNQSISATKFDGILLTALYLLAFTILMGYPVVHYFMNPGNPGYYGREFVWITLILLIPLQNLGMMLSHHTFIRNLSKKFRMILFFYLILISVIGILFITLIKITAVS